MGGADVAAGTAILAQAGIPVLEYPDAAARIFDAMWRSAYNLRALYETPSQPGDTADSLDRDGALALGAAVRASGRTVLTEFESKQLLIAYGIPTVATQVAKDEDAAVAAADAMGYPVVLKVHSETITHKTDVGGVQLDLASADAVRSAYRAIETTVYQRAGAGHFLGVTIQPMVRRDGYELIVGSSVDRQFGPVLLFGTGGQLVEVFKDRALGLPPLTTTLARRMMEQTRIAEALKGVRGRQPVDTAALEQLLVRFSRLVVEQLWIKEIDVNPLLVSSERLLALDARVIAHGSEVAEAQRPRPAIRPYPTEYVAPWSAKDGTPLTIRPIRPEDEPLMVRFHQTLSERSVSLRYFHAIKLSQRVAHDRLTRICFVDYDRAMVLVAVHKNSETGDSEIFGVGRLSKLHGRNEAEFALLVVDHFQGLGLGSELLRRLIQVGRDEALDCIRAEILLDNREMQHLCQKHGFRLDYEPRDQVVAAVLEL
jgi:acetyltransferase